ncbi:MAG: YdcH family protein [Acidobacteriota bacterium]
MTSWRPESVPGEREEAFQILYDRHQALEKRLQELQDKGFLDADGQMESRELKKQKLALKDRMAAMAGTLSPISAAGSGDSGPGS